MVLPPSASSVQAPFAMKAVSLLALSFCFLPFSDYSGIIRTCTFQAKQKNLCPSRERSEFFPVNLALPPFTEGFNRDGRLMDLAPSGARQVHPLPGVGPIPGSLSSGI